MINIAVCEDDDFDRGCLERLIPKSAEKLHVNYRISYFSSGSSLLEAVSAGGQYELLILDILMAGIDGIETARKVRQMLPDVLIGFITNSRNYAVEAFELDALHYLMKPVDEKRMDMFFSRYMERVNLWEPMLELDTPQGKLAWPYRDVLRIESYKKGVAIYFRNKTEAKFIRKSFTEVAELLDKTVFIQIARGLAVNMDYIDHISQGICYFADGTSALVSRKEKARIKAVYNEYLFEKMKNFSVGGGKVMSLTDYIIQFLGALIQSAPVVFLFFLPFGKSDLRLSGKKLYAAISAFLIAYALFFSVYIGELCRFDMNTDRIQARADLLTALGLCVGAVLGLWVVKIQGIKKLFVLLMGIYYEAVVYTISSLVINQLLFSGIFCRTPYTAYNLCTLSAATAVTVPLMWRLMSVKLREIFSLMDNRQLKQSCIFMGAELFLYCIFIFSVPAFAGLNSLVMVLCYTIGNVLALYSFLGELHTAKKQMQMEEKLRLFDLEYDSIKKNIEEMNRFRHDMRHHFAVIAALNTEGKSGELEQYLKRYADACESFENEQICDDPLTNTTLKYYIERCRRENIRTETAVNLPENLGFDFVDMTVLIGNCLENAINACRKLPEQERYVCIKIMKLKGSLLIYVENSCAKRTGRGQGKRLRPAIDARGRWHGYGTDSIKKIAEKYDGNAEFFQEDSRFITRVVLNVCAGTSSGIYDPMD